MAKRTTAARFDESFLAAESKRSHWLLFSRIGTGFVGVFLICAAICALVYISDIR